MKPKAQVEYRPIKDLKELPGNPRTIKKDQFEKLKTSIKDNADYFEARPIILSDRTGDLIILAGNQRYRHDNGNNREHDKSNVNKIKTLSHSSSNSSSSSSCAR